MKAVKSKSGEWYIVLENGKKLFPPNLYSLEDAEKWIAEHTPPSQ
jgi:hypothetical protein